VISFISDVEPSWRFTGHELDRVSVTVHVTGAIAIAMRCAR